MSNTRAAAWRASNDAVPSERAWTGSADRASVVEARSGAFFSFGERARPKERIVRAWRRHLVAIVEPLGADWKPHVLKEQAVALCERLILLRPLQFHFQERQFVGAAPIEGDDGGDDLVVEDVDDVAGVVLVEVELDLTVDRGRGVEAAQVTACSFETLIRRSTSVAITSNLLWIQLSGFLLAQPHFRTSMTPEGFSEHQRQHCQWQLEGYFAFVPPPLPPQLPID